MTTPVEPGATPPATPDPQAAAFQSQLETAERLRNEANARAQALEGQFRDAQAQLQKLTEAQAARERTEAEAAEAEAKRLREAEEEDLSAKDLLARRDVEWQQKMDAEKAERDKLLNDMQQQMAQQRLESEANQLASYTQARVAQLTADKLLAPQFHDFITGTSREEIDAALQLAVAKTAEIKDELKASRGPRATAPGVSANAGPTQMGSTTELPAEEIDYTNMSMKDYITKVRPNLPMSQGGQGIFG